jgi:hypothetical protein
MCLGLVIGGEDASQRRRRWGWRRRCLRAARDRNRLPGDLAQVIPTSTGPTNVVAILDWYERRGLNARDA